MKRIPSVQTLRAFEAAARHHGYSAAANELGLTHSAISHRIRDLESQMGVTLFKRSGREMVPTRVAITLLAQVTEGLQILARALPGKREHAGERLMIGAHHSLAIRWLIPHIGSFTEQYPEIQVEIHSSADLGDFINQEIDVAIRYGTGNWVNVSCERIADEVSFPVCTPAYRDRLGICQPDDLFKCTLLRHTWQSWAPWFRAAGLRRDEPTQGLQLSDSGMLVEAALAGHGVALARSIFARDDLKKGRLVSLFDITVPDSYSYYLLWNLGSELRPAAVLFRDWVRAEFQPTRGGS